MSPDLITQCPDLAAKYDETITTLLAEEKERLAAAGGGNRKSAPETQKLQKALTVSDLPWLIFDEWGRSWEKDFVIPGKYNLSQIYTPDSLDGARMFLHPFSTVGEDGVIIRDGDISDGKAVAGGHTFSW